MNSLLVEDATDGATAAGNEGRAEPQAAALEMAWPALRSQLQAEKERIQSEISSYPTPIAGCDEQFNYLLERRTQVRRALARLPDREQADSRRGQSAGRG